MCQLCGYLNSIIDSASRKIASDIIKNKYKDVDLTGLITENGLIINGRVISFEKIKQEFEEEIHNKRHEIMTKLYNYFSSFIDNLLKEKTNG